MRTFQIGRIVLKRARRAALVSALAAAWLAPGGTQAAVDCGMAPAFEQKDGNAKGGRTAVWADAQNQALMFIDGLNVNTDGTRRSYSVSDFWGERVALNNLCNAMSDSCAGLDKAGLQARRELVQQAAAQGWPAEMWKRSKLSADIIPLKNGKPCPEVDGFLVSATALRKPGVSDVCDLASYADALLTPALVLPKSAKRGQASEFAQRGARIGDLVVALRRDAMSPVFAVVGDSGPSDQLGEGSVALNGKLLGKTEPPVNYQELRGKGAFKGKAWTVPPTLVLIFPGSRNAADPWLTPERIDAAARERFEAWGGVARAQACAAAYPRAQ